MRRNLILSIACGALGGGLIASLVWAGLAAPLAKAVETGAAAEKQRLLDAFEAPLATALGRGDDLAKIDELRRLQNLSGVLSVRIEPVHPSALSTDSRPLIFEKKMLGSLRIRLSRTRWKRLRAQGVQRLWIETSALILIGGMLGWVYLHLQRRRLLRAVQVLAGAHKRHKRLLRRQAGAIKAEALRWTRQSLDLQPQGLILLNSHQIVKAANRAALRHWGLASAVEGRHWLEIQPAPEWAGVLDQSLQTPGDWLRAPVITGKPQAVVVSFTPDATWILSGEVSSHQQMLIV